MAGRMGGEKVTISGLLVMKKDEKNMLLIIRGLVPGRKGGRLLVKRMGQSKKFTPLLEDMPKMGSKEGKITEKTLENKTKKIADKSEEKNANS